MGSQALQSRLWGQRPEDWANIQEETGLPAYKFSLDAIQISASTKLLDVGCGTGYFCKLADELGAIVTGFDATPEFITIAQKRVPNADFITGEMEELPFLDNTFDVVCGFNSFQYAANTKNALAEAKRVLKTGGKLVAMIWGNKEDCEATSYLKAIGSLLPPPPPGAPGPFALTENSLLENILTEIGLTNIRCTDVSSTWDFPNQEIALRGLLSAGPAARAIENSGFDKAYETLANAVKPYVQSNGRIVYHNKNRVVISEK